jgi:hypothetical protein
MTTLSPETSLEVVVLGVLRLVLEPLEGDPEETGRDCARAGRGEPRRRASARRASARRASARRASAKPCAVRPA